MNIVKYISFGCFPVIEGSKNEEKNLIYGTLLLFGVTSLTLITCFVLLLLAYKNPYFIHILEERKKESNSNNEITIVNENSDERVELLQKEKEKPNKKDNGLELFWKLFKELLDVNLLLILVYCVSFIIFPGALVKFPLFGMNQFWKPNTIVTLCNVADTIGRYVVLLFGDIKRWMMYVFSLVSIAFLFLVPLGYYYHLHGEDIVASYFLVFIGVADFFTNGVASSIAYGIANNSSYLKDKATITVSFFIFWPLRIMRSLIEWNNIIHKLFLIYNYNNNFLIYTQIFIVLSSELDANFPSFSSTREFTISLCPFNVNSSFFVVSFQTFIVLSLEPETSRPSLS